MNSPELINDRTNSKLEAAEDAVTRSVERLEAAMEGLASRVEDSSKRVKHTLELASRSTEELVRVKDSFVQATAPLRPFVRQSVDTSRRFASSVRGNPKPYFWAILGLASAYFFWSSRNRSIGAFSTGMPQGGY